jgi:NAD-dependent deacetylase
MADARARIAAAGSIAVLTGAGISADSGIPTFRGSGRGGIGGAAAPHGPPQMKDGLWRTHRAEELATPDAFARDPRLVWEWYDWRRGLIASKQPNPAHHALAALEQRRPQCTLITQNVDGLHAAAGSRRLLELHGNIWRMRCTVCGARVDDRRVPLPLDEGLPACRDCRGLLRPDIVWFGESLEPPVFQAATAAAAASGVFLVIGTSGVVQPAASLASVAREGGSWVVEVNPQPSDNPAIHCRLAGRAADVVPLLLGDVR